MPVIIYLDQQALEVRGGLTVAAAVANSGVPYTRTACSGAPRAPFCGMGICQECRMTIDGRRQLACQTLCRDGMQVERSQ
ncbi:(2Fe-2S)-binding protein [Pseudomonas idahonensis]|uniref:(2Fe-2S)-binding protein n=1 Tax=unclassified Pseudomonas TaxID=196821 RepID=UPI001C63F0A9|nr:MULTISPECIES: (2Fe-2S)-binding protein [Pseudomonas]MCO7575915.1 (2Fe-2S)-binding protein [Pseudomonas protegens]MCO7581247.1 (2Fe-2S)-binding protein [Pseudomonas chlororaphis]MCO7597728.1 (2Fe-2S)-binding protein [Pseudomonas chlororaphis]MDC7813675.1 (2Fe-2S)-binding protein [Pseudomonas sp. BLCC-B112]MDD1020091.1 (2Fe-2S)-binding protein [Pseudomonas idahonensis]